MTDISDRVERIRRGNFALIAKEEFCGSTNEAAGERRILLRGFSPSPFFVLPFFPLDRSRDFMIPAVHITIPPLNTAPFCTYVRVRIRRRVDAFPGGYKRDANTRYHSVATTRRRNTETEKNVRGTTNARLNKVEICDRLQTMVTFSSAVQRESSVLASASERLTIIVEINVAKYGKSQ